MKFRTYILGYIGYKKRLLKASVHKSLKADFQPTAWRQSSAVSLEFASLFITSKSRWYQCILGKLQYKLPRISDKSFPPIHFPLPNV